MKYFDTFRNRLREYPWPPYVRRYGPPVAILIVGLLLGALLFGSDRYADEDVHTLADHQGVEVWTCSMHPQIRQPEPGQCPICGMDLIPASTEEESVVDPRFLTVSDAAAALMDVQVWPVERRDVEREVRLFGRIGYDETAVRDIILRAEGQVEQLHVNFENAPVRAGQALAEIYSPAIQAAARELIQAGRSGDERLIDASREQLETLGLTSAQVDAIREEGSAPRTYTIFSPASGVVAELGARQGDWVQAGGRLMRIAGLGQVWAQFEAYESDLAHLQTAQLVRFEVEAYPGRSYTGRIAYIDPSFGDDRRTVRVRVNINNPDGTLRPGMFIRGEAGASQARDSAPLVIPASAPLITGERALVYVRVPGHDRPTFEPREIVLGSRTREFYSVQDGLAEGELVVTHGAFKIDSELQIRGRRSMMSPAESGPQLPHSDHVSYPVSDAAGRTLQNAGQAYLSMVEALAEDDPSAARSSAQRMERAIERTDLQGAAPEAIRTWERLSEGIFEALQSIREENDIDRMRSELQPLTHHMETVLRTFESDQVGEYFLAFCPMAFDDEGGTWLQSERAIANPYFGSEMLTCGEIRGQVAPELPRRSNAASSSPPPAAHVH